MGTLENLRAKIAKLQEQAEAIVKDQSSTVIAKIRELMQEHGLTISDIEASGRGKKRGRKPASEKLARKPAATAKYRDPKSGVTWSGMGRAPGWIAKAKDRSKFLIVDGVGESAVAAKKPAKAGNYVRGPQAPQYRDPKTGATWSGRGRAPAWIAGAKDRTKFLIAADSDAAPKQTTAKKVSTHKLTIEKVPAGKLTMAKKIAAASKQSTGKKSVAYKPATDERAAKKSASKKTAATAVPLVQAPEQVHDGMSASTVE
ncbi:H-NS family nucleoid-associated regulatory protein [Paraburkholderia sp. BL17N1]|uniref:H-NS family nucleoid-associated regulatory protein n=1 Tax=Paraburkholderia sp. BL17N1 TaxID=1938798 RepID=UPI000EADC859|nr:H-NS family nucleoid-associated regulatory protein [Paraburkholderia sp. BL17N1]RKR36203.1 DNA-binding protein H-NS [Paraburkholderia sp. BL17N1]